MPWFGEVLDELLRTAGAVYSCIADPSTGELLAEAGAGDAAGLPIETVLGWGAAAAASLDVVAGDELDDLMITSRRSYHLVRRSGAASQPLLIYLRLDRRRSNLAVARRELAAPRLHARLAEGSARPVVSPNAQLRAASAIPRAGPADQATNSSRARRIGAAGRPRPPAAAPPPVLLSASPAAPSPRGRSRTVIESAPPADAGTAAAVPLPRRAANRQGRPTPTPEPAAGVAEQDSQQDWARDPRTLRRLLVGLRALRDK